MVSELFLINMGYTNVHCNIQEPIKYFCESEALRPTCSKYQ